MKQVKREAQRFIDKCLLAFAEKIRAPGTRATDIAWRRHAAAIEKSLRRRCQAQENLLAQVLRPNGFITLQAIAIEGVIPMRRRVEIFAFLRIASVSGLLQGPAIRNHVVNVCDGRNRFRRNTFDVVRVSIEPVPELTIDARSLGAAWRQSRSKIREPRQTRRRFHRTI